MLQIYVAYYQLISSHPTSCIAVCWRLDDPDPFLQGPPIPQGWVGYHCSSCILNISLHILLSLRYRIWSSFQYLILTYSLVTYFNIHASLAWNQLSSSYPTSCIPVGSSWMAPTPCQDPPIPQGEGGWWVMTMTMAGGVGGGPEPGTYIYTHTCRQRLASASGALCALIACSS